MKKFYDNVITDLMLMLEKEYKDQNIIKNSQIKQI